MNLENDNSSETTGGPTQPPARETKNRMGRLTPKKEFTILLLIGLLGIVVFAHFFGNQIRYWFHSAFGGGQTEHQGELDPRSMICEYAAPESRSLEDPGKDLKR